MLQALIETYLRESGCYVTTNPDNGMVLWGHPMLGGGRYFHDVVRWVTGCEKAGDDLAQKARDYYASIPPACWQPHVVAFMHRDDVTHNGGTDG